LGGLGAGFAILMLMVAWRLSSGPISLSYITPYIENALNAVHPAFKFRLENTILTWAGWERTFDIRVINVRLLAVDDAVIATIPEISLSLSARALAQGKIAPKSIEMFGPRLVLERQRDGTFAVALGEPSPGSDRVARRLIQHLLTRPDPKHAMSYLSRVEVIGADLTLLDQFSNRSCLVASKSCEGFPSLSKCLAKRPSVRAKVMKLTTSPVLGMTYQSSFMAGFPCRLRRSFMRSPLRRW